MDFTPNKFYLVLFSPHEGGIAIRKADSKTIFMEMKPHEHKLDKPPSKHLN